jgi:acetoacetyl-CoA synthetase
MSALVPLWSPTSEAVHATRIDEFRRHVATTRGLDLPDATALQRWSVANKGEFWSDVWSFCDVVGDPGGTALAAGDGSMLAARFFPEAQLNYAQNVLRDATTGAADSAIAIEFLREDSVSRQLTWGQLRADVAATAAALRVAGVEAGDRVAAWMPNIPETIVYFLAANSIGAVFSSTSADFGVAGVIDRFGQIEPVVLIAADGYCYGGKQFDCLDRLASIREALPTVREVVVVANLADAPDLSNVPGAVTSDAFIAPHRGAELTFRPAAFDQPVYILYSSGTTGVPKCIVHRAGGVLLKHLTEQQLHCDVRAGDRVFYFTTCGWMMWNWLVSALASQATIVLFDGNPQHPGPETLFDLADRYDITLMGLSAKFIDAVRKGGLRPADTHRLSSLRTVCSTGSPLAFEGYEWVYSALKHDVHLASICGGTDLCGSFLVGDPTRPVFAGELQGPALGMQVDVFDDAGQHIPGAESGNEGELVCTGAFPSMPLGFLGDPQGARYHAAYYERFPEIWAHGDFAAWTPRGGMRILGRSDATLNASGVRIGTAEIYRIVERIPAVG